MTAAIVLGIAQTLNVLALLVAAYAIKIGRVLMESDKPKRLSKPNDVGSAWEDQHTPKPTMIQKIRDRISKKGHK